MYLIQISYNTLGRTIGALSMFTETGYLEVIGLAEVQSGKDTGGLAGRNMKPISLPQNS